MRQLERDCFVLANLVEVEASYDLAMFLSIMHRLKKCMTCVIEKTNNLLASINDLMVAYTTGICQGHSATLWILDNIFDAD